MKTKLTRRLATFAAIGLLVLAVVHALHGRAREITAKNDMYCLVVASQTYRSEFGHFPTGTFSQVCQALGGDNPQKMLFMEVPPERIQPDGTLVDPWGSAYRLDCLSTSNVVAHSAGKDQTWGTTDDITRE